MSEFESRGAKESDSRGARDRRAVTTDLLVDHERRQRGHPPEHGDADGEHHEHQRPAATETEEAVPGSEPEAGRSSASVVGEQIGARVAALGQATLLQVRELEGAGNGECASRDDPLPFPEPGHSLDGSLHGSVAEECDCSEPGPDRGIAAEKGRPCASRALLAAARGFEEPDQRKTRGQHHRRHHCLPGKEEE